MAGRSSAAKEPLLSGHAQGLLLTPHLPGVSRLMKERAARKDTKAPGGYTKEEQKDDLLGGSAREEKADPK